MHCDDAPCQRAARNGAVVKRSDGIVLIDPHKSQGQDSLIQSCPYGAIWWNEERQIPQKCTLCAHLLDSGWAAPRCVQACPTGALTIEHLEDDKMEQLVRRLGLEVLSGKQTSARPTVYYRNLHRFERCFIAGTLATQGDSQADCIAGANVRLFKEEQQLQKTMSDAFGDFKFDGLSPQSGAYRLEIEYQAKAKKTIDLTLQESCSVGTIWL